MRKYFRILMPVVLMAFILSTFIVEAEENPIETPVYVTMPPSIAGAGIGIAFIIAIIAAVLFPAKSQSKLWIKILGTEWGAIGRGRIWTFISVLIVVALLWAFLIWVPPNY